MGESQAGERPLSKPKVDGTWGNKLRLSSGLCRHTDTCGVHTSTDTCKNTCNVYACMCTHTRHSHWEGVTCKFTHTHHSQWWGVTKPLGLKRCKVTEFRTQWPYWASHNCLQHQFRGTEGSDLFRNLHFHACTHTYTLCWLVSVST